MRERTLVLIMVVVLPLLGLVPVLAADKILAVSGLTVENLVNPLGIDTPIPRFRWVVEANYNGARQVAYEIRVSSAESLSGDIWSSGRVESTDPWAEYGGKPLQSRKRYYWAVRVWNEDGKPSEWSEISWFETAFLDPDEFQGKWISRGDDREPEILLRKEFSLGNKEIASARIYIAVTGIYKLFVNGLRIGDRELDPAYTNPDKTVMYVTHDVTKLLRPGEANVIGVSLGNARFPGQRRLKLQLDVTYVDGTQDSIVSDETWKVADGPTLKSSVTEGEVYDARLEQPGWNAPGFDDSEWSNVAIVEAPKGRLKAQTSPPIRVTGELPTPVVKKLPGGSIIYDFQTTRAGWATITVKGPRGAEIRIKYGEKLNDDGTVHLGPTIPGFPRPEIQSYTYVLRGEGEESFTPSYSYCGYRYVQIDAPEGVEILRVVGKTVHADVPATGDFSCSNELFNRYHRAMQASVLSNLHWFPTDTPMYEKAGWTGDGHIYCDNALLNFDSENFWEKWMCDHRDYQAENGLLPVALPDPREPQEEPVWTYSYIGVNWALYWRRGNVRTLREHYDGMKRWMEYYMKLVESTDYIYEGFTYGDHEAAEGAPNRPENAIFPRAQDNKLLGTLFIYDAASKLAEIARVLGKVDDSRKFEEFAKKVREAYNAKFYDPDSGAYYDRSIGSGSYSQAVNAVALAFGVVPEGERQKVFDRLAYDVDRTWDGHVSVGAVGVKFILPMLTEGGYAELAYKAATTPTYPGWGWWFQSLHGLDTGSETIIVDTMWEAWRWFLSQSVIDSSRSHNHAFRGVIDDWLYEYVAGIRPAAPAYRKIVVKPHLIGDLNYVSAYITTPLGRVSSEWKINGAILQLKVHIPVSATAEIWVPVEKGASVSERGGAKLVRYQEGYAVYEVGSGDYIFWTPRDVSRQTL
ncbi:MAG: family 78 glycoside hydrolase catalytic domain [Candidatus Caldatribacterium sp.]|nr:family 78 glycoside hydrolase catalytic domain [Candidatus Caldatribacterium sp.]